MERILFPPRVSVLVFQFAIVTSHLILYRSRAVYDQLTVLPIALLRHFDIQFADRIILNDNALDPRRRRDTVQEHTRGVIEDGEGIPSFGGEGAFPHFDGFGIERFGLEDGRRFSVVFDRYVGWETVCLGSGGVLGREVGRAHESRRRLAPGRRR